MCLVKGRAGHLMVTVSASQQRLCWAGRRCQVSVAALHLTDYRCCGEPLGSSASS